MARGQRKTLDVKIQDKKELIQSLTVRIEKEKKELEELLKEQRLSQLELLDKMIAQSELSVEEVQNIIQSYKESQIA